MENEIIVVNGLILTENKILLCKKRDWWILPGGKMNKGEDYIRTLQRELEEEMSITSLKIDLNSKIVFKNLKTISGKDIKEIVCYKVEIFDKAYPKNEILDIKYLRKKDLMKINLSSATREILGKIKF